MREPKHRIERLASLLGDDPQADPEGRASPSGRGRSPGPSRCARAPSGRPRPHDRDDERARPVYGSARHRVARVDRDRVGGPDDELIDHLALPIVRGVDRLDGGGDGLYDEVIGVGARHGLPPDPAGEHGDVEMGVVRLVAIVVSGRRPARPACAARRGRRSTADQRSFRPGVLLPSRCGTTLNRPALNPRTEQAYGHLFPSQGGRMKRVKLAIAACSCSLRRRRDDGRRDDSVRQEQGGSDDRDRRGRRPDEQHETVRLARARRRQDRGEEGRRRPAARTSC